MTSTLGVMRISLQTKVLVPVLSILVLVMALSAWDLDRRVILQFETDAQERLETANKVFHRARIMHEEQLLARYRDIPNAPRVKAVASPTDRATLQDFCNKLLDELDAFGAAAVVFRSTTPDVAEIGAFARTRLGLGDFTAASQGIVRQTIETRAPAQGVILAGDALYNIFSAPIEVSGQVTGVLTFAHELGANIAEDVRQIAGSHIVFLYDGRVLFSTLGAVAPERDLAAALQSRAAVGRAGSEVHKILLGGERFFWRSSPMNGGNPRISYALLSSYEQPFQALQDAQSALLWVQFFGVALVALIFWQILKRVTQPLRELRESAEAVGRGDFAKRVQASTRDEVGDLARSFNQMAMNLTTARSDLEQTVSTLKTSRAQLIQSEKLSVIGEFVAGVAHELNNPLTGVVGYAQLLNDSDVDLVTQKTYSRRIVQSALRCQRIVQNLLSFARQHPPESRELNLNDVLESVVDLLHYELRLNNIEVTKRFSPDLPPLMGDGHQLQQVFLNIINNARQAMEDRPDSHIVITTERSDIGLRIIFEDNGPGISANNLSRIFDPFFTTKEVGRGTGLGLSLSYGIIQEHGGRITARSEPGNGSAFILDLPLSQAAPVTSASAAARPAKVSRSVGAGKRLLAVDDEEHVLQLARDILQAEGYHVDTALNGEEALTQLSMRTYDLILCDIKMPGMSGEQFFERLRGDHSKSADRIIFMTGEVMSPSTDQFLKKREKRCLAKPFSPTELRAAVEESAAAKVSI